MLNKQGYIYIMGNDSFEYYKIGKSIDPERRATDLSTTSVPFDFFVLFDMFTDNMHKHELIIHKELEEYRVSDREFFLVDYNIAVRVIQNVINPEPVFKNFREKERVYRKVFRWLDSLEKMDKNISRA